MNQPVLDTSRNIDLDLSWNTPPDDSGILGSAPGLNYPPDTEIQPSPLYAEDKGEGVSDFLSDISSSEINCDSADGSERDLTARAGGVKAGSNGMCNPKASSSPSRARTRKNPEQKLREEPEKVEVPVDCSKIGGNPRQLYCCLEAAPIRGGRSLDARDFTRRRNCRLCKFIDMPEDFFGRLGFCHRVHKTNLLSMIRAYRDQPAWMLEGIKFDLRLLQSMTTLLEYKPETKSPL